jgi:hypothetical protein
MKVEMGKEYTTRDGRAARIYAADGGGTYPVHGAIRADDGSWIGRSWKVNGSCYGEINDHNDLIEAPRKFRVEVWANVNQISNEVSKTYVGGIYPTRKDAGEHSIRGRIACVRVVIEGAEGDGLTPSTTPETAP